MTREEENAIRTAIRDIESVEGRYAAAMILRGLIRHYSSFEEWLNAYPEGSRRMAWDAGYAAARDAK